MNYEDILHLLISDISKFGFFQGNNLEKLFEIRFNLKIPKILIMNLEREYSVYQNINK